MLADATVEKTPETLSSLTDETQSIDIRIFDVEYRLEVLKILEIIQETKIQKYMAETRSGFVRYRNKSILSFDVRDRNQRGKTDDVTVLVIEARRNDTIMPIGFMIESFEDFYKRLK